MPGGVESGGLSLRTGSVTAPEPATEPQWLGWDAPHLSPHPALGLRLLVWKRERLEGIRGSQGVRGTPGTARLSPGPARAWQRLQPGLMPLQPPAEEDACRDLQLACVCSARGNRVLSLNVLRHQTIARTHGANPSPSRVYQVTGLAGMSKAGP